MNLESIFWFVGGALVPSMLVAWLATFAARRLHTMIDNVAYIIAIELLAAAQGIEFHRPKKSSSVIEAVIAELREISPAYEEDRSLSSDIRRIAAIVDHGAYLKHSSSILPSLNA